jgi:hypothetical protein
MRRLSRFTNLTQRRHRRPPWTQRRADLGGSRGHHAFHRGARRHAVKTLRVAPTPSGLAVLTAVSVEPDGGLYVMAPVDCPRLSQGRHRSSPVRSTHEAINSLVHVVNRSLSQRAFQEVTL